MPRWIRTSIACVSLALLLVACVRATPSQGEGDSASGDFPGPILSTAVDHPTARPWTATPPPTPPPTATITVPVSAGTPLPVPAEPMTPGKPLRLLAQWNAGSAVNSLDFSPVGGMLASSHNQYKVVVWDVASREQVAEFEHASPRVMNIVFSADGSRLASVAAGEKKVYLWDVATASLIRTHDSYGKNVYSVAFSPEGQALAAGFADRVVIWDTSSGAKLQTILGGNVIGLDYAPDGQVLAASTIPSLDISRYGKPVPFIPPEKRGSGYVSSSTAQYYFGGFWLWDLSDTSSPVDSGEGAEFAVFSPEGKEIVALGYDEQVHVLNVATGERRTFPIGFRDYEFLSAALSPDGSYLALGGAAEAEDDGFIARLDLSGETNFPGFGYGSIFNNGRMKGVTSISVSPDGLYLATGESDGTIRLWGSW